MALWDREKLGVFWENRSGLEKKLILFILFLSIVLLVVILCVVFIGKDEACTTVDCVGAATHILDYVDFSVRPCENFHDFVCGSYINKAVEYNKKTALTSMMEKTKGQIDSLITINENQTSTHSVKLQRQFYRSCINTSAIEQDENDMFLTLLDSIGGWPVIKGTFWDGDSFDWKLLMIKARKLGLSFQKLIGLSIGDGASENVTILMITPPDDVEYISNETMEPYMELMRDVAIFLHSPSLGTSTELRHVPQFQNELYRIISKARNASNEPKEMTMEQLQEKYPRISWRQFLNAVMSDALVLNKTDLISIASEQYLIDLEMLLLKTTKRIQANYIIWKMVENFIPFLTENIRNRYNKYQRQYVDKKTNGKSRKEECVQLAKHIFSNIAEIDYVRKYTDPDTKKKVKNIFESVKVALLRRLKASSRLEVELDRDIEKEMRSMEIQIGGSDLIFDVEKAEKALGYNDLVFSDRNLVKMVTKTSLNRVSNFFAGIGKPEASFSTYTDVNAFYNYFGNNLVLSVPLLHGIFYDKHRPNYMNYGALVSTIGHEFAHSLEKLGNKTSADWGRYTMIYNEAFTTAFGNSSQCFKDEYSRFQNKTMQNLGIPINVNETLEENIADFVGTDIAYDLYQDYVREHGVEKRLPGIDMTPNQLFWVMTGTFLCGHKPAGPKEWSFHANSEYRINHRLRHLPEFSRDFHCPVGSFMNPEVKCELY